MSIASTLGPIFFGQAFSTIAYGFTILQAILYYTRYSSSDRLLLKLIVAMSMVFETTHLFVELQLTYYYIVIAYADLQLLAKVVWGYQWIVFVGSFNFFLIQMFFAHRIFILSKENKWIPSAIVVVSIAQFVATCFWTAFANREKVFGTDFYRMTKPPGIAAYGLDIASNGLITISTIYFLRKNKSPFSKTEKVLDTIINYTIKSCLLITVCNIYSLITEAIIPPGHTSYLNTPSYEISIRLYTNSLLSTLNNRQSLREKIQSPENVLQFADGEVLNLSTFREGSTTTEATRTRNFIKSAKEL